MTTNTPDIAKLTAVRDRARAMLADAESETPNCKLAVNAANKAMAANKTAQRELAVEANHASIALEAALKAVK